jgi:glycosyltransferase involved in cell wall biosynthesis
MTGVDRVEAAYLDHLTATDLPVFGIVRLAAGFALLDRAGMHALCDLVAGHRALAKADLTSHLLWHRQPQRAMAEAAVRRLALRRCWSVGLTRTLRHHLRPGFQYLNVGHSNLSGHVMTALRSAGAGQVAVLVHDVIPLDHPEYTRRGVPAVFRRKMGAVAGHADLVIHTTDAARARTEAHLARLGRVPPGLTAPLGVPTPQPAPGAHPGITEPDRPYFVILGTIEPRKNHALLLDVWDQFDIPARLLVIGRKGWADPALFRRIEVNPRVSLIQNLPDGDVAAILAGARGLLFPTFAEGFGLPPVEAALLGVPVICSDLPVLREVLKDYPVYLGPTDPYSWGREIKLLADAPARPEPRIVPGASFEWAAHFDKVFGRD